MDFVKVGAACPKLRVADVNYNVENIIIQINEAYKNNTKLLVFPELSITSYTCGDLFTQKILIEKAYEGLHTICADSKDKDILIIVGAPLLYNYNLYNCAFAIFEGKILGIVPKSFIPNYTEFYEKDGLLKD